MMVANITGTKMTDISNVHWMTEKRHNQIAREQAMKQPKETKDAILFQTILNYKGKIYDMGIKEGTHESGELGDPWFYILTDECEQLSIPLTDRFKVQLVCDYLNKISSGIHICFDEFKQFSELIDRVFKQYCKNQTPEYYFDNTDLKRIMKDLNIRGCDIVIHCRIDKNPIGASTVYDLLGGITHHPRFTTVCKIQKALFDIVRIRSHK